MKEFTTGQMFKCPTHAALINHLFDMDIKGWQKAGYSYGGDKLCWFLSLTWSIKEGWRNIFTDKSKEILQEEYTRGSLPQAVTNLGYNESIRAVFRIVDDGYRKYIFEGMYQRVDEMGRDNKRFYKKISDSFMA